jgi:hypothetical protein
LKQWEDNMLYYGKRLVEKGYVGCCDAYTGPWYYDGGRAFLQMYDYTGYQPFLDFARKIHGAYKNYMLAGGSDKLYAIFPQGLASFHERFGDAQAKEAIRVMQGDAPGYGPLYHWGAGWRNSRPEAYGLSLHLAKERVGFPRLEGQSDLGYEPGETYFAQCLANVLGQMEQWFVSETARYVSPFLVGLNIEALIEYYELSRDPEVPYLLKLAADKLYPNPLTWHEASESMMLVEEKNGQVTRGPAPDLNLMIAPLYAWLCRHTGDAKYCDIGDRIFASGVRRAYLDQGKQFVQNYRWSFKYVEWRAAARIGGQGNPPPAAEPTLSISANPSSIQPGQSSTLLWSSGNATSCSASGSWSGSKPLSSSQGVQPASNATYTLTCAGSGGSVTRSATVNVSKVSQPADDPPSSPPANPDGTPAIQLSSSASTVQPGALVTLSWASSDATSCYAWGGWSGARAVRGTESVRVNSNTRYTLGCSGPRGGTSRTLQVTVSGDAPSSPSTPAPSLNLASSPTSIRQGQTATLSWTSSNASSCLASGSWGGSKPVLGNQVMQPSGSSSYTLTCSGAGGSVSRAVSVAVTASAPPPTPAPSLSLNVSPSSIQQGQSTLISWSSSNATSCSASGSWGGSKPTSGNQSMQPSSNAAYRLTCTGAGGSITRSAAVSVATSDSSGGIPSLSLSTSTTSISSGGSATLSWSSQDTTACVGAGGWSGTKPLSGNQTVRPLQTTLYILGCSGPRGGVSRVVQVVVK